MPRLLLGVDGGGTNCRVRLADETLKTLGEARGGASNLQLRGGDLAYRSILEGTAAAFAAAGIPESEISNTYACFCMAGGRSVADRDAFEKRPWKFAGVRVYDDIDAAHAGALGGDEGAAIIAGTGSAALAVVDGVRYQCGGWGFHIGDQMSGAILGRELVRRAVEAKDGLVTGSPLTDAVIEKLGGSLDAVMDWSFPKVEGLPPPKEGEEAPFTIGRSPRDYGQFSRMIFDHLAKGDPVARELMDLQLGYVDNYVRWFKARGAKKLAPTGGVSDGMFDLLVERYGDFIVRPEGDNLSGALVLCRRNFAPT